MIDSETTETTETTETASTDAATAPWWFPIWEFLVHVVVGTTIFLVIALPAIGIELLIVFTQAHLTLQELTIQSLKIVEYALLAADVLLFLLFIVKSTIKTARTL